MLQNKPSVAKTGVDAAEKGPRKGLKYHNIYKASKLIPAQQRARVLRGCSTHTDMCCTGKPGESFIVIVISNLNFVHHDVSKYYQIIVNSTKNSFESFRRDLHNTLLCTA